MIRQVTPIRYPQPYLGWKGYFWVEFSDGMRRVVDATWPISRRLRLPFGIAKPFEPWTCTRVELMRGTLPEFTAMVTEDRARRAYDRLGVDVFLRMMRRVTTRANKRQGWAADGSEVACG